MRVSGCFMALVFICAVLVTKGAGSQDFPSKPVRFVTAAAGSNVDFAARVIAQGLATGLGQVVIDNRSSGVIQGDFVSKSAPDGYTLLVATNPLWIGPLLQKAPYDPVRDFSPVSLMTKSPSILVVHPYLPVKSVKELIALAKSRPGELNYASGATGTSSHLAAELFKNLAGVKIERVVYKGAPAAVGDLINGQVQVAIFTPSSMVPLIKSGKLRALAVSSAQPSALFPELPTIAASGLQGYESVAMFGVFAPAKTPRPIIDRLNQEISRVLKREDVRERFFDAGSETVDGSPDQLGAAIKSEISRVGKVIKDAGIHDD